MFKHDGEFHCVLYQRSSFCALMHSCVPSNPHSFIYSIKVLNDDEILDEIPQNFLVFPQISESPF